MSENNTVTINPKLEAVKDVTTVDFEVTKINQSVDGSTTEIVERHVLKYDMNAFVELEKEYGTIDEALSKASTPQFKDIVFFLWAGILHNNATLDDEGELLGYKISKHTVGSWFTPSDLKTLAGKIWTAVARDLRTENEEGKNE